MGIIFLRKITHVDNGTPTFDPASLFASGEEGVWYEPSPTTCFTDTGGTTAATYGNAVAYLEDLSGNGNHATQTTLASRPILARVPETGRRNELDATDTLATQSVTVTAVQRTLSFKGTGTVTLTGASTAGPLVGTGATNRVSLTFTPSAGSLTLTVSGTVTEAQLQLGAAFDSYQSVVSQYDITEAGVTSLDYLFFDGVDDGLETASIDFAGTDKVSVFAGVLNNTPSASGYTVELSTASGSNNGAFGLAYDTVASDNYFWRSRGTTTRSVSSASIYIAPTTNVVTGLGDISGDSSILRVDGVVAATDTNDQGSGDYGNYPLYIGHRGTLSSYVDGNIYGLIVRGASSTATEITDTETYLAARSGVTL